MDAGSWRFSVPKPASYRPESSGIDPFSETGSLLTLSSSAESANYRFLSSRQAVTCAGTYQRLQGRRVAADTAIWHRKVRDNGRRYGRGYRPGGRWGPGPG